MGKATGFLEYERKNAAVEEPLKRIRHFNEFRTPLPLEEQQKQGARCMECGVPFCQNGAMLAGMASGCPLHNLDTGFPFRLQVHAASQSAGQTRLVNSGKLCVFVSLS